MKLTKIIITMSALITVLANAGNEGGGGVGYLCNNKVYLADTYEFMINNKDFFENNFSNMDEDQIVYDAISKADTFNQVVAQALSANANDSSVTYQVLRQSQKYLNTNLLKKSLAKLKFIPQASVRYVGDDNIQKIPDGCTKIPIAYQKFASSEVFYDRTYFAGLSKFERAYLKLHEILIHIEQGIQDTSPIRNAIALITGMSGITKLIENKFAQCDMGSYVHRVAWLSLRAFYTSQYNIDIYKSTVDGKLAGKLSSKNSLQMSLSEYVQFEDLEEFIGKSYVFLIYYMRLKNKKDPYPYPEHASLLEIRRHYMDQAKKSSYSSILRKQYSSMSVCEYTILVNSIFEIDKIRY